MARYKSHTKLVIVLSGSADLGRRRGKDLSACARFDGSRERRWSRSPRRDAAPVRRPAGRSRRPPPSAPRRRPPRPPTATTTGAVAGTLTITAFDLGFKPAIADRAGGRHVRGQVQQHRLDRSMTSRSPTARRSAPRAGATATGTVDVPAAGLAFLCSIPGPRAAGMKGEIMVAGGTAADARHARWRPGPSGQVAGDATTAPRSPTRTPRRTPSSIRRRPSSSPGTVHDIDLPIIDKDITVAEGFVVTPGPSAARSPGRRSASTSATPSTST